MANTKRPAKRRVPPSGRVTAKGTRPGEPTGGGRYTPPVPRATKVSPRWVPVLMFFFLGAGSLVIFLNYLGLMPGGETNNWYLLVGLGGILAGIITATQYH